eukprot:jgi/Orpsp1_1/1182313/evm.model.c7180000080796.1
MFHLLFHLKVHFLIYLYFENSKYQHPLPMFCLHYHEVSLEYFFLSIYHYDQLHYYYPLCCLLILLFLHNHQILHLYYLHQSLLFFYYFLIQLIYYFYSILFVPILYFVLFSHY